MYIQISGTEEGELVPILQEGSFHLQTHSPLFHKHMTGSAVGVGLLLEIPALNAYSWSLKLSPNLSLACAPLGTHMADDQEPHLRLPPSMRGHLELVTDGRKQSWV